uniref:Ethylene-responsive element-binding family protein n=1 Tax=Rhizophora mucronata TaxID=61149 RepID=A0A2P2NJ09_RHIMU
MEAKSVRRCCLISSRVEASPEDSIILDSREREYKVSFFS